MLLQAVHLMTELVPLLPTVPRQLFGYTAIVVLVWELCNLLILPNLPTALVNVLDKELNRTRKSVDELERSQYIYSLGLEVGVTFISIEKQASALRIAAAKASAFPLKEYLGLFNGLSYSIVRCTQKARELQAEITEIDELARRREFSEAERLASLRLCHIVSQMRLDVPGHPAIARRARAVSDSNYR